MLAAMASNIGGSSRRSSNTDSHYRSLQPGGNGKGKGKLKESYDLDFGHIEPMMEERIDPYADGADLDDDSWADQQQPIQERHIDRMTDSTKRGHVSPLVLSGASTPKKGFIRSARQRTETSAPEDFASASSGGHVARDGHGELHPVSAMAKAAAQPRKRGGGCGQNKKNNNSVDPTRDWQLSEKDFSGDSQRRLVTKVAALGLQTSYQAKMCKSVGIDQWKILAVLRLRTCSNERTSHMLEDFTAAQKADGLPTFVVVVEVFAEEIKTYAELNLSENDPDRDAITAYCQLLDTAAASNALDKAYRILEDFRYFRIRNTHLKTEAMLKIGIAPLITKEGEAFFQASRRMLTKPFVGAK